MDMAELATKLEGYTPTDLRAAARILEGTGPAPEAPTRGLPRWLLPIAALAGGGLAVLVSALITGHP